MGNKTTLNIGVVGAGGMGQLFAHLVTELPGAHLTGIADITLQKAKATGDRLGVPAYTAVDELLQQTETEAVIIATADDCHVEPVRAAVRAGKAIFLEKPLATSVADARSILVAVARSGVPLMVGHCARFDPRYMAVRQAIQQGQLGQLLHLAARRVACPPRSSLLAAVRFQCSWESTTSIICCGLRAGG